MLKEDEKPIEEMSLPETIAALQEALAAFQKEFDAPTHAAKARARKVSLNLEKLLKQYRRASVKRPE